MAINAYGVVGTIDDSHWSKLLLQLANGRDGQSHNGGFTPTVATGTRKVSIDSGAAAIAGVWSLATNDVTYSVTHDSNTGTQSRIDVVVLTVDWTAATAAYNANTGSESTKASAARAAGSYLDIVKGQPANTPSVPQLTQTAGTLWQMPLARVLVRPGVGQFLTSDLTDARPYTPEKVCSGTIVLSDGGTAPKTLSVAFPVGFFRNPPRVQLTPQTGAAAGTTFDTTTVSNLSASSITAASFAASLNRTTTTSVTVSWTASGN